MGQNKAGVNMTQEILAEITPSTGRRAMATGLLVALGVVLIYVALNSAEAGAVLRAVFLVFGIGGLLLASRAWTATIVSLTLTPDGLYDSDGRVLCQMQDIAKVERGAFAFKPSNGFAILLKTSAPRAWAPGLWWRFGRRLGVGGVTSSAQAKFMADMIALRLAKQEGRLDLAEMLDRDRRKAGDKDQDGD